MISALTMSIFVCIYLYSKHRQSLEQIKKMMVEFDKLTTSDENSSILSQLKTNLNISEDNNTKSSISLLSSLRRKSVSISSEPNVDLHLYRQQKENQLITEKNLKLVKELNSAKVSLITKLMELESFFTFVVK